MDIIIVGAGASGIMAARQLAQSGLKVLILEARNRIGGRIHTIPLLQNTCYEAGAEFVHGRLPVTLDLFKEAGIKKKKLSGNAMQYMNGEWKEERDFFDHADLVIKQLKELNEDISIADFLSRYFSERKFSKLRKSLISYIEGYYSGDAERCSSKTFLEEFESEDEELYRPANGYKPMLDFLLTDFTKAGGTLQLSTVVKEIRWSKGLAEVVDEGNHIYAAHKVLITLPLGVWNAGENSRAFIKYTPSVPEKINAARQMGFGSVIKILFYFNEPLTENKQINKEAGNGLNKIQFALTDQEIPTWWTQLPVKSNLLTGWVAGPDADKLRDADDKAIFNLALQSLSKIIKLKKSELKKRLLWWKVHNWIADPFTRGSYCYSSLHTKEARKIMSAPLQNTLFFAGEGLYNGPETGTVEAALISGKEAALQIINTKI